MARAACRCGVRRRITAASRRFRSGRIRADVGQTPATLIDAPIAAAPVRRRVNLRDEPADSVAMNRPLVVVCDNVPGFVRDAAGPGVTLCCAAQVEVTPPQASGVLDGSPRWRLDASAAADAVAERDSGFRDCRTPVTVPATAAARTPPGHRIDDGRALRRCLRTAR